MMLIPYTFFSTITAIWLSAVFKSKLEKLDYVTLNQIQGLSDSVD